MGITDPTEEYFKDGAWGWNGSAWIKGGLPFTYTSQVLAYTYVADAAAGSIFVLGDAVPAGYIWVITGLTGINLTSAVSGMRLGVLVGALHNWVSAVGALAATIGSSWSGQVCLVAGNKPEALLQGCTLHDQLYFCYLGYAMKVT